MFKEAFGFLDTGVMYYMTFHLTNEDEGKSVLTLNKLQFIFSQISKLQKGEMLLLSEN